MVTSCPTQPKEGWVGTAGDLSTADRVGNQAQGGSSLPDLFQAKLAIVVLDNPVALAGGVF
jgi:hypothetical protein